MSKENHHNDFINFKNYYSGKMKPEEKSDFENKLEQDPFAKEAFEGFLLLETNLEKISTIDNSNNRIKERLGLETAKASFPLKSFMTIAASVVILIGSYFFISNNLISSKTQESVAENIINVTNKEEAIEKTMNVEELEEVPLTDSFQIESLTTTETYDVSVVSNNNDFRYEKEEIIASPSKNNNNSFNYTPKPTTNKEKKQIDFEEYLAMDENEGEEIIGQEIVSSPEPITSDINRTMMNTVAIEDSELEETTILDNVSEYKKGIVAYNKSEYVKAIKSFNISISKNINVNSSNFYIGMSYFNQRRSSKAIKYFDKLLNTSLKYKAEWYKALSLINKGNKNDAKKLLHKIANSNSNFKMEALNKLNTLK